MRELTVEERESGGRLDKYLLRILSKAGKPFIYKMLRKKNIKLNGAKAFGNEILKSGDRLTLYLSDETFERFCEKKEKKVLQGAINIVYEDENILICNKQAGLLSQPSEKEGKNADSLIGRIESYLGTQHAPALANRLDRNTTGLVMCGKDLAYVRALNEAVFSGKIKKIYLAAVIGEVKSPGTLKDRYYKDQASNTGHIGGDSGKEIITSYRPIAVKNGYSLLEIELETGKSHQIRLHLKSAGYPVLGDNKYGNASENAKFSRDYGIMLRFQCLHAYKLVFSAKSRLSYLDGREFTAPLPEVFNKIIYKLFGGGFLNF